MERASRVDLSKYSLVVGIISGERAAEAMQEAILSTSKKDDKSDRKVREQIYAGIIEPSDKEPVGIVCGKDGATGTPVCSLTTALALATNVEGRAIPGADGMLLPSRVTLTGKLAAAVADALPAKAGSAGTTGAGPVECKTVGGAKECTVPLTGFGAATRLDQAVEQSKAEDGPAKANELAEAFETLVGLMF